MKCLDEEGLQEFIRSGGEEQVCSYCGNESLVSELSEVVPHIFSSLSLEWAHADEELPFDPEDGVWVLGEPTTSAELLGFYIFDNIEGYEESEVFQDLCSSMPIDAWAQKGEIRSTNQERLTNSWEVFCHVIKHERRYFFANGPLEKIPFYLEEDQVEWTPQEVLENILKFLKEHARISKKEAGWQVARCRSKAPEKPPFTASEMGPPPIEYATQANRMSPAGVPMFYGAVEPLVCVREISDKSGYFACATFQIDRPIWVVDLTGNIKIPSIFDPKRNSDRPFWFFISRFLEDFRKPVAKGQDNVDHIEYAPTQVVSEFLRCSSLENGDRISGVLYESSKAPGSKAVVLFIDNLCVSGPDLSHDSKLIIEMVNYEERNWEI